MSSGHSQRNLLHLSNPKLSIFNRLGGRYSKQGTSSDNERSSIRKYAAGNNGKTLTHSQTTNSISWRTQGTIMKHER